MGKTTHVANGFSWVILVRVDNVKENQTSRNSKSGFSIGGGYKGTGASFGKVLIFFKCG